MRRYIDWVPFQRPKISDRCPDELIEKVFEENKDLLIRHIKMRDKDVSREMRRRDS